MMPEFLFMGALFPGTQGCMNHRSSWPEGGDCHPLQL